jgi:hypothetical protein
MVIAYVSWQKVTYISEESVFIVSVKNRAEQSKQQAQ